MLIFDKRHVSLSFVFLFAAKFGVIVFASLRSRSRRTLHDLYFLCWTKVMIGGGTLCEAYLNP